MKTATRPNDQYPHQQHNFLPFALLLVMMCTFLLLGAVLPLYGLKFNDALLTQLGTWPLLPTAILFPHQVVTAYVPHIHMVHLSIPGRWRHTALLLAVFLNLFLLYLLALRLLPRRISHRYILASTLLLGILCVCIPVTTSTDLFSYIAYARIGVIYHLNPLTTLPAAIHKDPVYPHISWSTQPSAYGPSWTLIASFLQWLTLTFGFTGIVSMVLALRLLALVMHLGSSWLIWSISGHLQRNYGFISPEKRLRAMLAFAWNPLLLFEAGVNAHNDVTLLFFVLLAIWLLARRTQATTRDYMLAAALFALATCIKLNIVLLAPGLLLFLWLQPHKIRNIVGAIATYLSIILLLYAPFWQDGAVLQVLWVNPTASRNINTLSEFLGDLYNGIYNAIAKVFGYQLIVRYTGSLAEHFAHLLSIGIFVIIYALLWWRASRTPRSIGTLPGLIRWLAVAWLLYSAVGTPWFWSWYTFTFFGLYALIEASSREGASFGFLRLPLAVHLFTFSLLSLYCFFTWKPLNTFVPGLPGFQWAFLRGLWVWALPFLALRLQRKLRVVPESYEHDIQGKELPELLQHAMSEVVRQSQVVLGTIWRVLMTERRSHI